MRIGVEPFLASHADVLRSSSRVGAGTRNEPLRTSAWEAKPFLDLAGKGLIRCPWGSSPVGKGVIIDRSF